MDIYKMYDAFLKEHKNNIEKELREVYRKKYFDPHSSVMRESNFSFHIGLPLFLLWLFLAWFCDEPTFMAIIVVVLGFIIRNFSDRVITNTGIYFFEKQELYNIVRAYSEACREKDLLSAKADSSKEDINRLYDYCAWKLPCEHFTFHK